MPACSFASFSPGFAGVVLANAAYYRRGGMYVAQGTKWDQELRRTPTTSTGFGE
jgi:hypothetical protein